MTTTVVIADDENLIRNLYKSALRHYDDIKIAGEAADGEEVINLLKRSPPDVLLLDLQMPRFSGFDVLKHISKESYHVRPIVISMNDSDENIRESINAGALGFLSKTEDWEELHTAIKTVSKGEFHYSKRINSILLQMALEQKKNPTDKQKPLVEFTERELSIIAYLNDGLGSAEIAEKLFCSQSNVDRIRQDLIHRVKAKNTVGLLNYANQKK